MFTEPATLNNPGEKAEDNVSIEAVTMANMEGASRTYSWETWPSNGDIRGRFFHEVPDANISLMNTKSDFKPLYIYEPGTEVIPYGGGIVQTRPWFSKFPIWNHWPVAQIPSDGRDALALDHVSSSAITSPEPPMTRRAKDGAVEGRFLMGLTKQPITRAFPIARAWGIHPSWSFPGQILPATATAATTAPIICASWLPEVRSWAFTSKRARHRPR